jgi:hypothetical protein
MGEDTAIVTVIDQPPIIKTLVLFDGFESGTFANWTESNEFDWNIESPAEINVPDSPISNFVAHADNCTSSSGCRLTLKNYINLTKFKNATLSFSRFVDDDIDKSEYLRVEAYNGSKWKSLATWSNNTGDDNIWHQERFDLSKYLVTKFKIRFTSKEHTALEDTEIDDVLIEGYN